MASDGGRSHKPQECFSETLGRQRSAACIKQGYMQMSPELPGINVMINEMSLQISLTMDRAKVLKGESSLFPLCHQTKRHERQSVVFARMDTETGYTCQWTDISMALWWPDFAQLQWQGHQGLLIIKR